MSINEDPFERWMLAGMSPFGTTGAEPTFPIDVREKDNEYIVYAALPGVNPRQVNIQAQDNTLRITGEIPEEKPGEPGQWLLQERPAGHFERLLTFPSNVAAGQAQAEFQNGMLVIELPKTPAGRQIPIQTGQQRQQGQQVTQQQGQPAAQQQPGINQGAELYAQPQGGMQMEQEKRQREQTGMEAGAEAGQQAPNINAGAEQGGQQPPKINAEEAQGGQPGAMPMGPGQGAGEQAGMAAGTTPSGQAAGEAGQVRSGMTVYGTNGDEVGLVKEVRSNDFLVNRSLHRDIYVPFNAVQTVRNDQVVLTVPTDQIDTMNWPSPPIFGGTSG